MDSTIIDFLAYREEVSDLKSTSGNGPCMSNELINEIQILIQRLRDSNPIKQTG